LSPIAATQGNQTATDQQSQGQAAQDSTGYPHSEIRPDRQAKDQSTAVEAIALSGMKTGKTERNPS
jgi:hypothetical protein